jgi:hypothetical protein
LVRIRQLLFGVVLTFAIAWAGASWAQGINRPITRGLADGLYLKLDASNDPITGLLQITGGVQNTGTNDCFTPSGDFCVKDDMDINGLMKSSLPSTPLTVADTDGFLLTGVTTLFSDVVSGFDSIKFNFDGARFHLGTGSVDYLTSDGVGVIAAGKLTAANTLFANTDMRNGTASNGCASTGAAATGLCTFDDSVLDGVPYVLEMTTPTAEAGYGTAPYPKADGNWYVQDSVAGAELQLLTGGSATGQMHQTRNTTPFVINANDDVHAYHSDGGGGGSAIGLTGSQLNNWTFNVGGDGTPHAITSIVQNGSDITVTTGTSHTMVAGAIASITNTGDGNYDKIHVVNAVTATTFDVTATFGSTATGTLDEAATLIAGTGAAGSYTVTWWCSASAVGANHTFDLYVYKEAALVAGTEMRRKFSSTDFGVTSGGGRVTITDGDHISMALSNVGASGNIVRRNVTLLLEKN